MFDNSEALFTRVNLSLDAIPDHHSFWFLSSDLHITRINIWPHVLIPPAFGRLFWHLEDGLERMYRSSAVLSKQALKTTYVTASKSPELPRRDH